VYLFVLRGATLPASDGRTAVVLEPGERDLVLAEMRDFLGAVQTITAAVVADQLERVVPAARRVGGAARHAVPVSLAGKLPLAFKQLGFDTHARFDRLALDAEQLGDPQVVLSQLAELLQNCVACHAAYRLEAATP
jgi:cytochrome c556